MAKEYIKTVVPACGSLLARTDVIEVKVNWRGELHGKTKTPEYKVWNGIRERCYNKKMRCYPRYGGRGIKVCARWRKSFSAFLLDMGQRPSPRHTIDRIDSNGDYAPENCRWATRKEQLLNRNITKRYHFNGQSLTLIEISEKIGIQYRTLWRRVSRGMPLEKAFTCSLLPTHPSKTAETNSLVHAAGQMELAGVGG